MENGGSYLISTAAAVEKDSRKLRRRPPFETILGASERERAVRGASCLVNSVTANF